MSMLSLIPEDRRKDFDSARKESVESVYSSSSRLTLLQKRKKQPRSSDMSSSQSSAGRDRYVAQRVLSAKTHRVKQLQNQLADAHFHLQELSNENRILRAVQKKHEIALSRYESSNAELPIVLNSHTEEMRIQTCKYKELRRQHKDTCTKLKERDLQLQQLQDEHQHILDLTRDRNLPEREKLQQQVIELKDKIEEQNKTISILQRKLALEAKNFRHHLQTEMNKHRDTRQDLDRAITNADKLSTIIEMKEKLLSKPSSRKSPVRQAAVCQPVPAPPSALPRASARTHSVRSSVVDDRNNRLAVADSTMIAKFCETSRTLSSALSREEDTTTDSSSVRIKGFRSRASSSHTSSNNQTRKNSKESDDMLELAKTVQDGMSGLAIFDEQNISRSNSPETQKNLESLKQDLLNKIKNNNEPQPRLASSLGRYSTDGSVDDVEDDKLDTDRSKTRSLRSGSVSFFGDMGVDTNGSVAKVFNHGSGDEGVKLKREKSNVERKLSGKSVDKYCKSIMQDIEKSSQVIDRHVKDFTNSKIESEKLVKQLEAVDKIHDFMSQEDVPDETLVELNNNFKVLTNQTSDTMPVARKRSISSRKSSTSSKPGSRVNLFGDASLSNQDLLNDLLGKK